MSTDHSLISETGEEQNTELKTFLRGQFWSVKHWSRPIVTRRWGAGQICLAMTEMILMMLGDLLRFIFIVVVGGLFSFLFLSFAAYYCDSLYIFNRLCRHLDVMLCNLLIRCHSQAYGSSMCDFISSASPLVWASSSLKFELVSSLPLPQMNPVQFSHFISFI